MIKEWPDPVEEDHPATVWCQEQKRMFSRLAEAIERLIEAQNARVLAIKQDGRVPSGIDEQIKTALHILKSARQAYMHHLEVHGC